MSDAIPAHRIHLKMAGLPQAMAEPAALALVAALGFCAQPETFPVFHQWAQRFVKETGGEDYAGVMAALNPAVLKEVDLLITAGMVAELEDDL